MISTIRPYMNIAATPQYLVDDDRFDMPELIRPRRRGVREFSLEELLGVIPAPPLDEPVKPTAMVEIQGQKVPDNVTQNSPIKALENETGISVETRTTTEDEQHRDVHGMKTGPSRRHMSLPKAA